MAAQLNRGKVLGALSMTPLIDVVFLLLIFFMISTTFTKETSLKINLPESAGEQAAVEIRNVEIQISEKSQYALAVDNESAKVLINSSRDTLIRALEPYKNEKKLLLIIRADQKAPHESVIKVMDVAQELGLTNLTFATKKVAN